MKLSRIRELRRREYCLVETDRHLEHCFSDQLESSEKLGALLEDARSKLVTAWGLLQDLFNVLYLDQFELKERAHPVTALNKYVLDLVMRFDEIKRLRGAGFDEADPMSSSVGGTLFRRDAATRVLLRIGKKILDAIPDPVRKQVNQMAQQNEEERGDEGDVSEEGAGGKGKGDAPEPADDPSDSGGALGGRRSELEGDPGPDPGEQGEAGEDGGVGGGAREEVEQPLDEVASLELEEILKKAGPQIQKGLKQAARKAMQEEKQLEEVMDRYGYDRSEGSPILGSPDEALALAERLAKDEGLQKLFATFGNRLAAFAQAKREQRITGRGGSVAGLEYGRDLKRATEHGMALLAIPELEVMAVEALARGKIPMTVRRETRQLKRGDLVVLLDLSYSTRDPYRGEDTVNRFLLGVALALFQTLMKEGRGVWVIPFMHYPEPALELKKTPEALLWLAGRKPDGGTDFEQAIDAGLALLMTLDSRRPPDLLMLTDGECRLPEKGDKDAYFQKVRDTLAARRSRIHALFVRPPGYRSEMIHDLEELVGPENYLDLRDAYDFEKLGRLFVWV